MSSPGNKIDCSSCSARLLGVLCDLKQDAMEECGQHKTTNTYKRGQVLYYEGNQPLGFYCVYSGRIKLYKTGLDGQKQIVRIMGPGSILGYRSLFTEDPHHSTAEALEDATICCVDKKTFLPLITKNPALSINIIKKLSEELRDAELLATNIAQRSVRERMAELILMLKEAYGNNTTDKSQIEIQLSRQEMGDMIGITEETAIRMLSNFKKDGLISIEGRNIAILDMQRLFQTANLE